MAELTDEEKKSLERLERYAKIPRKPSASPNTDKFTGKVLVPESEYVDWHVIADKGQKRPSKSTRVKKSGTPK